MSDPIIEIRPATRSDVLLIHSLILALAEYEQSPGEVSGTPDLLDHALFGPAPSADAVIAEIDGEPVGFAVFHGTFSTWECRPGLWLEDFFVLPKFRRAGVGDALFRHVAGVATERGCSRFGWAALDWNKLALSFYRARGAEVLSEWLMHRLTGDALRRVAAGEATHPARDL